MAIKEEFGLSLFGFDVIVPVRTVTYSNEAQMGIGTRIGILQSRSSSSNHHDNGFSINEIASDTDTCDSKTMGMGVTLNGSRSVMIDEKYKEKDLSDSANKISDKENGDKEGKKEREFMKMEEEKEKEKEEGQGQGCRHLCTGYRIEPNQTSSKIPHHPANLESLLPSDPRSASLTHSDFSNKSKQDIQQYSQVIFDKNAYLSRDSIIINSENKEEITINEEKDKDETDLVKDKEKDKNKKVDQTEESKLIREEEEKKKEEKEEKEEEEKEEEEKKEEDVSELVVIDVNYFPSYKEVPDFPMRLRKFLRQKAGMALYSTVQN